MSARSDAADPRGVVPRRPEFPESSHQINNFAIRAVELELDGLSPEGTSVIAVIR
jgi:hypothetical protein